MSTAIQKQELKEAWWLGLVCGILPIVVGALIIAYPAMSWLAMIFFLGIFWLVGGIAELIIAALERGPNWGWSALEGALGVLVGFFIVGRPAASAIFTAQVIFAIIVILVFASGIASLIHAFNLLRTRGLMPALGRVLIGALELLIGVFLLANSAAATGDTTQLAVIPQVFGILLIIGGVLIVGATVVVRSAVKEAR